MSGCPWCALQLAYLKPYLAGLWSFLDFRLRYIVSREPLTSWYLNPQQQEALKDDTWEGFVSQERFAGFESLSGRAHLMGDAWELCAQRYYGQRPPQEPLPRFMEFVLCMSSNYNEMGEALARRCAQRARVDFDGVIDKCARHSSEGRRLLREAADHAEASKAHAAPMLVIHQGARAPSVVLTNVQSNHVLDSQLCARLACLEAAGKPATTGTDMWLDAETIAIIQSRDGEGEDGANTGTVAAEDAGSDEATAAAAEVGADAGPGADVESGPPAEEDAGADEGLRSYEKKQKEHERVAAELKRHIAQQDAVVVGFKRQIASLKASIRATAAPTAANEGDMHAAAPNLGNSAADADAVDEKAAKIDAYKRQVETLKASLDSRAREQGSSAAGHLKGNVQAATVARAAAVQATAEDIVDHEALKAEFAANLAQIAADVKNDPTSDRSVVCGILQEEWPNKYRQLVLRCPGAGKDPAAKIRKVLFASYGGPFVRGDGAHSQCADYWYRDFCHAPDSMKVVEQFCLDRMECRLLISGAAFGRDPCPGKQKLLGAVVLCGRSPDLSVVGQDARTVGENDAAADEHATSHSLFVVNLRRRPDRRKKMERVIDSSTHLKRLEPTWVGVDGSTVDLAREWMDGKLFASAYGNIIRRRFAVGTDVTAGSLGCSLSHLFIWQSCAASHGKIKLCIVFEDDVELVDNFDGLFEEQATNLPQKVDLWYFASMLRDDPKVQAASADLGEQFFRMSGQTWGTYAYAITPIAARELASWFYPVRKQVDTYMMDRYQASSWSVLRSKTDLVKTDNKEGRDSDVQTYKEAAQVIPEVFHVISSDGTIGDPAAVRRVREAGSLLELHPWKLSTSSSPKPDAQNFEQQASLTTGSLTSTLDGPRAAFIACLLALFFSGGVCVIDHDVDAADSLGSILRGVEFFAAYEYDRRVSERVLGAVKEQETVRTLLLMHDQWTGDGWQLRLASTLSPLVSYKVVLFAPYIFTPLPSVSERRYGTRDSGAVLSFPFVTAGPIPRVLHFIQLGNRALSESNARAIRTWIAHHPRWRVRMWTDDDIQKLSMADLINNAEHPAQKADLMRLEVIYSEGGVYVDTDIDCFRGIDDLIVGASGLACHEGVIDVDAHDYVANGFLAASKRHPIMARAEPMARSVSLNTFDVNMQTGPALWSKILGPDIDKFRVLPQETFYPVTFWERKVLQERNCYKQSCRKHYPRSHGLHLYAQTVAWDHKYTPKKPSVAALRRFEEVVNEIKLHNSKAATQ
eukprot:g793.t1